MAGLIYKDFLSNRKMFFAICGAILLVSVPMFVKPPDYFMGDEIVSALLECLGFAIAFLLMGEGFQNCLFEADERKKWADYVISTPLAEKGQVFSKYCLSMVCSCLLILFAFLSDMIVNRIKDIEQPTGITGIFLMFLFSLTTFMRAIEFPFYIRFGKKNGNKYRAVLLFSLFLLIHVYVLFGDLSIFMSKEAFNELVMYIAAPDMSKEVPPIIMGITTFTYLFPAISFVAYYFSYKISVKLYKKGVECYDK